MSPDFFDLDDFLDELFLSLSRGSGETDTEDFERSDEEIELSESSETDALLLALVRFLSLLCFFALWWWCLAFVECLTIWDATTAGLISTTRESVEVVGV
jgi:hypothetical protein